MSEEGSDKSKGVLLGIRASITPSPLRRCSPSHEQTFWANHMAFFGTNVKEEPIDDTRNDSGVTSGSECPSTSPASDRSGSHPSTSPPQNNVYPFSAARASRHQYNPWYPANAQIPLSSQSTTQSTTQGQQMPSSDRNSVSPKNDLVADDNSNGFDDDGIRHPKVNSHGKVKVHKCKQCDFFSYTKLEFWEHSGVHIKGDKILKCPKCPFVTEYKHHLEYHLLNHAGAKPFKCPHCDYSCVNKSMLNSHLKSHSKVYQYRCANCQYETKYCHSLKLHLRKYNHKPAMVLNPDGSPNPLPIIDVYGTRRGPKVKKVSGANRSFPSTINAPQVESQPPQIPFNPLINPLLNQNAMLPFPLPLIPGFPALPNQEMMLSFQNMFRERLEELAKQNAGQPESQLEAQPEVEPVAEPELQTQPQENGALDLSNKSGHTSENGESDEEDMTIAFDNVEVVENKTGEIEGEPSKEADSERDNNPKNNNKYDFACQYCGICFGDEIMFRIHMGYHGYSNPFTCNMCGEECENKVNFFLHIARAAH